MLGRDRTARTLGEHAIFGDEEAAQLRAELDDLRASVTDLAARVHSQFTTIAAHAEIAREQAEFARAEARADLDRTRDMLIGLIEQARADRPGHHVPGTAPGPSIAAQAERFEELDRRLAQLAAAVDTCFERQRELADTMAAMIDTVFAGQRGEPVTGLSLR